MGGELCISNPAESGSHSWKCILVSNTSDSAITKLGYCGRRERFSSDVELAKVFWKLWHSKKEYLDLPDGWSGPEEQQKFKMVCEAMQGDWETGTTPFDLFDKYEESGEDELEDMRDFSINYWRQIGNYDSNANDYLWDAKELYIRRDMLKNYLKDLNSGVSEDIVDSHYWPEFTDVEKDSIYGLLQWWDTSLGAEEIDTWFSQYPPMINVVETRWIEDARPELFTTMPIPWNPDETYVAESNFDALKTLKKRWREDFKHIGITYEEMLEGEINRLRNRMTMKGFDPNAKIGSPKYAEEYGADSNSKQDAIAAWLEGQKAKGKNTVATRFMQKQMKRDKKEAEGAETFASENMVGECGYCASMQGYTPENMLLIADHPDLSHDFCKSCNSHHPDYKPTDECKEFNPRNPDVYEGNTWFCQGCGSGTKFLIDANKWVADAETFASECESCDEESDGGVYECDCCYQVYCENCFEETVDAGHSPYRGSIDEWMSITKNPRIEETSTGSSWSGGAICGNCAAEIETELEDLTPIPELMEDEQGTANLASESKELKRTSCCCGATVSSPCACMYEGIMNCSANAPMCPCYKALAEKNAESPTTKSKSKHITEIVLITALIGGVIASMKRK